MRIEGLIISAAIFLVSPVPLHADTSVKIGVLNDFSGPYAALEASVLSLLP